MQHTLLPYTKCLEPFAWWDEAFTVEQLDWLQQKAREGVEKAYVGGGLLNSEVRRTELNWLSKDEGTSQLFYRLGHVVSMINADFFQFDLAGFGEELQLTNYHESQQGMYTWHQDLSSQGGVSRKLSLVMQLSHPEEYEGGELQLLTSKEPTIINKKRGLITVFPSWTLHQVTPVTKGSRQTLVAWVTGRPFK